MSKPAYVNIENTPEMGLGVENIPQGGVSFAPLGDVLKNGFDGFRLASEIGCMSVVQKMSKYVIAPVATVGTLSPAPVVLATTSVATGAFLLAENVPDANSATSQGPSYGGSYVPSFSYKCPADILKMGKNPLFSTEKFLKKEVVMPPDPLLTELILQEDRRWESLTGDPVMPSNECLGQVLGEQFQIMNNDFTPATGAKFQVVIPNAESGVRITGIKQFDATRKEVVNNCVIADDKSSVNCDLGTLGPSQYFSFNVKWDADRSVRDQPIKASITSDVADRDPTDNSIEYTKNVYPELINPFTPGNKPTLRSLKAKRINANCFSRPFAVTSLNSHLLNGKVKANVYFSTRKGSKNVRKHKTIVRPFADLNNSLVTIPVRVCGKGTKVDAKISVSASNLSDGNIYSTQAHLLKTKRVGKKAPSIVWRAEPWS